MEVQDASNVLFYKLWPWVEANKNKLIGAAVVVLVVIFFVSFFSWRRGQNEIAAGQSLTQLFTESATTAGPDAEAYLKVAGEYPGTPAAERAQLLAATKYFADGQYADAQKQFQNFLDAHPDGDLSADAALGVAACLEASGKTNLAAGAYQQVINGFSGAAPATIAKISLAQLDETQGQLSSALNLYEDVARANPSSALGSQAAFQAVQLREKLPATAAVAPAAKPAAAFNLSH